MADDDWQEIWNDDEQARSRIRRSRESYSYNMTPMPTMKLTMRANMLGFVLLIGVVIWDYFFVSHGRLSNRLAALICISGGFGLIYAPIGMACGYVTHRICRDSSLSERLFGVTLSLVVTFSVLGWWIYFAMTMN